MNITLRQLSYFLALIEENSFSRAAERVHVTQPALSMQIKELENMLQASLIERLPRGIRLTRAGRDVAEHARRVLAGAKELEAAARRQGWARRVNLGVIPTIAPYLLPRVLPDLKSVDKGRDIRVREAQTDRLIAALDEGQLDAIVIATAAGRPEFHSQVLFEDRFLLAGSPDLLGRLGQGRDELRPMAIDPEELLLLDEGHCLSDQALEVCSLNRRFARRIDLGASSLSTLCGLVGQGFGMTFLPEIAVAQEAWDGLALMRFSAPEPSRTVRLVRRAATSDDGWFSDLADTLAAAGQALAGEARTICR